MFAVGVFVVGGSFVGAAVVVVVAVVVGRGLER